MIDTRHYIFIIISISAGLLSLLGSVGIFISLIIQRKVERLQDILEELIEQTYSEDHNLTGTIYRLVQKYQMHYLLPDRTTKTIIHYVDATISLVTVIWVLLHLFIFSPPLGLKTAAYFLPAIGAIIILYFFRQLLKSAINPLDNPLLNGIIPPPTRLRSISFLSGYVNVSMKALLKQARFVLLIKKEGPDTMGQVILKEELSFDDFFYYISIGKKEKSLFVGFGKILFSFDPDPITGKPNPLQHNINVPMGFCHWDGFTEDRVPAHLLLFPYGEKHPIECTFELTRQKDCYISLGRPETTIANSIIYKIENDRVVILENKSLFSCLDLVKEHFQTGESRWYFPGTIQDASLEACRQEPYIN